MPRNSDEHVQQHEQVQQHVQDETLKLKVQKYKI